MSQSAGAVRNGLVLRFTVPASGELRAIASELTVKVAAQLGAKGQDEATVSRAIDDLLHRVASEHGDASPGHDDIAIEVHKAGRELRIEARSNGRASEARISLPG